MIGSDARTDGNAAPGGGDKNDVGRSDTTFLLHMYADHQHASAVSIPRDTLVTIPPCELPDGTWTQARTVAKAFPGAALEAVAGSGVRVVLGQSYAGTAGASGASASPAPSAVPSAVADSARSADENPCSNLTYG